MALSNDEYLALGFLVVAVIVLGILLVLKFFKWIIIAVLLAVVGYAFYAGWIHI